VDVATLSRFFALLAILCVVGVVLIGACTVITIVRPRHAVTRALAPVTDLAPWLAFAVVTTCTAGSLYYSLGADFLPCELCWYQRICMYPLVPVLLVGALRRDRRAWTYVAPLATVGAVLAAYHTQLQAFPEQHSFCAIDNPCTTRYVWEFGFVSLPFMALVGFVFVLVTLPLQARSRSKENR
jgi:disulfide bond formation protein DsbB